MATNRLTEPKTLDDMLLYVLWQLKAAARGPVVRVCEAEFGITRREWRMLAQLGQGEGLASSALAERAGLDRAQTSRAVGGLVGKRLLARTPRPGIGARCCCTLRTKGGRFTTRCCRASRLSTAICSRCWRRRKSRCWTACCDA